MYLCIKITYKSVNKEFDGLIEGGLRICVVWKKTVSYVEKSDIVKTFISISDYKSISDFKRRER